MIEPFHLHVEEVLQMKGTAGPSVVSDLLENCYTQAEYDVIKRVAATSYTGRYLSTVQKLCLIYPYPLAGIEPVCYLVFNFLLRLIVTSRLLLQSSHFSSQWPCIQMPKERLKMKLTEW